MATIVTVHGTFANMDAASTATSKGGEPPLTAPAGGQTDTQWWEHGSAFETATHDLLEGKNGEKVNFVPFEWNSNNSELERRRAGTRLLGILRDLDAQGEDYCLVGHSHGGSVISAALIQSVARGDPLTGLKKWITVGTPFIEMKRESFLFSRLNLFERMLFIASLMLFMMFAFYAAAEVWTGGASSLQRPGRFLVGSILMILPFVVFYIALKLRDRQKLYLYRPQWLRRAKAAYAHLWMPLCHENDEAVQGLKFLPRVDLPLFDRGFAISTISMGAMFVMPLIYIVMVTSPLIMVGMTNFMKNNLYDLETYERVQTTSPDTRQIAQLRKELRQTYRKIRSPNLDAHSDQASRDKAKKLREQISKLRRKVTTTNPEFADYERAQRFKRRFLERDGKPCNPEGTLCGKGTDYAINAKLLFHAATDELASTIVSDEGTWGIWGGILRLLVPIIVVPLISVAVAMAVLSIAGLIARYASSALSWWLNRVTLAEIKRAAFGNDTEGELAIGADKQPNWTMGRLNYLPPELSDLIAAYSNNITSETVERFRKAITTLTFAEGEMKSNMLATYFTWKELVHATYFEVPEFRKLVLHAIARTDAFNAKPAFTSDPQFQLTDRWLKELDVDNA